MKVADQRLQADGLKAQEAAAEAVENFEDDDDILGEGFVRLNIGGQTPKVRGSYCTSKYTIIRLYLVISIMCL